MELCFLDGGINLQLSNSCSWVKGVKFGYCGEESANVVFWLGWGFLGNELVVGIVICLPCVLAMI